MLIFRTMPRCLPVYLFLALNVLDILLTVSALLLGAQELNCIFAWTTSPIAMVVIKMVLATIVLLGLILWQRAYLIQWVNAGMVLVVIWNIVAVMSWS